MTDNENQNSEIIEVAPPVEAKVNEVNEANVVKEDVNSRHLKNMRLKNTELEKRLKEREDMLDKFMQQHLTNTTPQNQEVDEFDKIGSEEFIPKGQVEKLVEKKAQKYAEQIAKKEVETYFKKQQDNQFLDRLNQKYSDFSEIVNAETLSLLEEKEPELAQSITDLKDPYKIGLQSYKYIKAMNLVQKAPEARREKEIEKALEKSEKSVQSPAGFDKRPIAQAFKLTDAMKKDLYREMHGYASLANSVPELS